MAEQAAAWVLAEVQAVVAQNAGARPETRETEKTEKTDGAQPMPLAAADYAGLLELPEETVPVLARATEQSLWLAPGLQQGALDGETLVIAGHNIPGHFASLLRMRPGDGLRLVAVDGSGTDYVVARVETVAGDAAEAVLASGYPLTLYTCTASGRQRVAVFCNRRAEETEEETEEETKRPANPVEGLSVFRWERNKLPDLLYLRGMPETNCPAVRINSFRCRFFAAQRPDAGPYC